MAENIPNPPGGALPPKPSESSKIQPKKETVRINLPPKPTAAPTIKLPTLPPGGPAAAPGAPTFAAPPATAAPAAAAHPTAAGAPRPTAAAPTAVPAAQRPPQRSAAMPPPRPSVSGLDQVLAIAAAVVGLAALASVAYLNWMVEWTAK